MRSEPSTRELQDDVISIFLTVLKVCDLHVHGEDMRQETTFQRANQPHVSSVQTLVFCSESVTPLCCADTHHKEAASVCRCSDSDGVSRSVSHILRTAKLRSCYQFPV